MQISEQGLSLIKESEGFSPAIYICPAGKPTIGYGHAILSGEKYPDAISEVQAESLLKNDVEIVVDSINHLVKIVLNQNQFDALVSFVFNIGVSAFEKSTLLILLNNGDTQKAAQQLGRWVYGGGKIISGLVARRAAEMALFLTQP